MKKLIIFLLVLVMVLAVGCQPKGKFVDGDYAGVGEGKYGPIKVEVAVEKGKIKVINVVEHTETPGLSDPILEKIPASIIKAQSTQVEAISGATVTSQAVMDAVADALKDAK